MTSYIIILFCITQKNQPLFVYADVDWGEISEGYCKELQRLQERLELFFETPEYTPRVLNWLSLACRRNKCAHVSFYVPR